jgi:7-keto-8-aminopelargonate synthetase-like enzyme
MQRKSLTSPLAAEIVLDGKRYTNFAGSSYLGLSGRPEVIQAGVATLQEAGAGYQIARQYGMVAPALLEVEAEAAAFFGSEASIYLSSGYPFGLVSLITMRDRFDHIFFDELAHYSLQEAIRATGLTYCQYGHLDAEDLADKLKRRLRGGERPLVVTDGMYSTFGRIAPLDELLQVARPYDGFLLVDESHSFGVLGPTGRGAKEQYEIDASSILVGGSLSKAFGCSGGVIPAGEAEVAAFRNAPAAEGASPGSPAAAAMGAAALRYARQHPELLQRLRANVALMKGGLRGMGLDTPDTVAPVATFVTGSEDSMQAIYQRLFDEGYCVLRSNYIGAPPGGVIRCGIFADHTTEHIEGFLGTLRRIL